MLFTDNLLASTEEIPTGGKAQQKKKHLNEHYPAIRFKNQST